MARVQKKKAVGSTGRGQAWLADRLGISQPRVNQLINGEGWPFARSGWKDVEVAKIRQHVIERRGDNNASAGQVDDENAGGGGDESLQAAMEKLARNPRKLAEYKLIVKRAAKIEADIALLTGQYLKKEDVERANAERTDAVVGVLLELPLLAQQLVGKTEAEMEAILTDYRTKVGRLFAGN